MRILIVAFSVALFASRGIGAQDPSTGKKPSPSSSKSKTARRKSTAHKSTGKQTSAAPKPSSSPTASTTAHHRTPSKNTKRTQPVRRSTQQQPTTGRYKEIQQALVDRGYFNGPVDGQWGAESIDALKRFQREQNLTDDGKIGSLSLIALGLGPKRTAAEAAPERVQQR